MPVQIDWLVPGQVIYCGSYGVVGLDELEAIRSSSVTMMDEATRNWVHMISDGSDVSRMNIMVRDTSKAFRAVTTDPRRGWSLTVNPHIMGRFLGDMSYQFANVRGRSFSDMQSALRFLSKQDDDLPGYNTLIQMYVELHDAMVAARPTGDDALNRG